MDFEGAHGVLIIGGDENDGGVRTDQFENIEAGEFGHLHVQKNKVGLVLGDGFHGLKAISALGENFDLRMRLDQFAENQAR